MNDELCFNKQSIVTWNTIIFFSCVTQNGSGEVSESASTSSMCSNSSHSKAPGSQLAHLKGGMLSMFDSNHQDNTHNVSCAYIFDK